MRKNVVSQISSLYNAHNTWLVGWFYRRIGCRFDAEDLAHDTFLRLMDNPSKLNGVKTPRKWLSVIAKGLMIDWLRHRAVETAYYRAQSTMEKPVEISPETRIEFLETIIRIDSALSGINPKARTAFLLSRLGGLTYDQIGTKLNVSTSSVEKYMRTAIRHCINVSDEK